MKKDRLKKKTKRISLNLQSVQKARWRKAIENS